jgi:hypothetical protein
LHSAETSRAYNASSSAPSGKRTLERVQHAFALCFEGESHMPFTRVTDSKQRQILTTVVDDICRDAGIERGSPERKDAASLVMRLYWQGHRTPDELRFALYNAMSREQDG